MRITKVYTVEDALAFKKKLLFWGQKANELIWLDSNDYEQQYSSFDALFARDAHTSLKTGFDKAFDKLHNFQKDTKDWLLGYFTYDLKNDLEDLESNNGDHLHFPELFFFQPRKLILMKGNQVEFQYLNDLNEEIALDFNAINGLEVKSNPKHEDSVKIKLRIHKDEYFEKVNNLLEHIHRGDIYEANFCQEFYAEKTYIDPLETYFRLNHISKPPFATFLKVDDKYLMSASPERYLKKIGSKVISQPIKGTSKRAEDSAEDIFLKKQLANDVKEQSENIMIVDLVRNDLARIAKRGSVKVEELCKVYTFELVHQLISTVSCYLEEGIEPVDIIKATFPMGSMTGAPKISAMKLIEKYEETKRGLYSGAVGYFDPHGNFDFNVVIRSILYNESQQYVSYSVGGAITAKSDPLKEYEECLVKAKAMRDVLEN